MLTFQHFNTVRFEFEWNFEYLGEVLRTVLRTVLPCLRTTITVAHDIGTLEHEVSDRASAVTRTGGVGGEGGGGCGYVKF